MDLVMRWFLSYPPVETIHGSTVEENRLLLNLYYMDPSIMIMAGRTGIAVN
jgi:hypothetical protein